MEGWARRLKTAGFRNSLGAIYALAICLLSFRWGIDEALFRASVGLALAIALWSPRWTYPLLWLAASCLALRQQISSFVLEHDVTPLAAWPWLDYSLVTVPAASLLVVLAILQRERQRAAARSDAARMGFLAKVLGLTAIGSWLAQAFIVRFWLEGDIYYLSTLAVRELMFEFGTGIIFAFPWVLRGTRFSDAAAPSILAAVAGASLVYLGYWLDNPLFAYASLGLALLPGLMLGLRYGGWVAAISISVVAVCFSMTINGWPLLERITTQFSFVTSSWLVMVVCLNFDRLRQQNRQLVEARERERLSAVEAAGLDEHYRNHVARELHDEVGQHLTAAQLGVARFVEGNPVDGQDLQRVRSLLHGSISVVRNLAMRLSGYDGAHLDLHGSLMGGRLHEMLREAGMSTSTSVSLPGSTWNDLPGGVNLLLYRIFQESVSNAVRHAKATHCHITLMLRPHGNILRIIGSVRDNGAPGGASNPGFGLRGMRARVESMGGSFKFHRNGHGAAVKFFIEIKHAP